MPVEAAAVSVATTATALNTAESSGSDRVSLLLFNNGAQVVYLGPAGVTTSSGMPLAVGASVSVNELSDGERLFGIVAATTCEVRVLRQGAG